MPGQIARLSYTGSTTPSKLQQFVLNRVKNITEFLPASQRRLVRSQENPSDLASRGLSPQELPFSKLWWLGPPCLQTPGRFCHSNRHLEPCPPISCLTVSCERDRQEMEFQMNLANRFSSFHRMTRAMGWISDFSTTPRKQDKTLCPTSSPFVRDTTS